MKHFLLTLIFISVCSLFSFSQCDCKINMSFERAAGGCFGQDCGCNCLPDNGQDSWEQCRDWSFGSTDIEPGGNVGISGVSASNGKYFMSMTGGPQGEGNAVKLCAGAPLKKGVEYCFEIDLTSKGGKASLALYGGMSSCDMSQLLWTSPAVSTNGWGKQTFCFTPTNNWTHISFRIVNSDAFAVLGIDNWVSKDGKFPPQPDGNCGPTVSVRDTSVCAGECTKLTAVGKGGTPGYTYSWSDGQSGASITVCPGTTTKPYTVTLTDAAGKTATATANVTVIAAPAVTVNSVDICPGSSATLTATGATTYSWSPSTGLSATTGATVTANPSGSTTYTVIGTNASGCKDTAISKVNVVNNLIAVVSADTAICKGASAQLLAGGGATYSWTPATGLSSATIPNPVATPTVTTTYEVTVSSGTCNGKKSVTVTVVPGPLLTATGGSICPGDSLQLNVADANASAGLTYSWTPGASLSDATIADPYAHPATTTTYTVTGTTSNGCISTATATVTITNTLIPTVNADTGICIGTSVQLKAGGGSKYEWTPATGLSNPAVFNPVATPTVTTTYEVKVSSGTCVGTKSVTITVYPLPLVTATSATVCQNEKTTLTATGASTYTWNNGSGLVNGTSISLQPLLTTTYTVTGTDVNGCKDTTTTSVTVNELPVVAVSNAIVCNGVEATLTATGGISYTWQAPSGTLSATASVTVKPTVTSTYTVTGTSLNGCKNTAVATVTVNPIPDIAVNNGNICKGTTFTLKAVGSSTAYTWAASDGSSLPSLSEVVVAPVSNATYTVTGTAKGCSDTAIAQVNVNDIPVISVTNAAICAREEVQLIASGGSTYQWSTGASGSKIFVAPSVTTSYTVTGTQGICSGIAVGVVTVYGNPVVSFYPTPRELSEDEPSVKLFNSSIGKNLVYEWNFGDTDHPLNESPDENPTHLYSGPGIYTICLKATDSLHGCTDSACKEIIYKPQWTFYVPNAFTPGNADTDNLNNTFCAYGTNILKFRMLIFDRWGNQIFESDDLYNGWDGKVKGKQDLAQQDVYVWKIDLTDVFNKEHQYIGHVTLVK